MIATLAVAKVPTVVNLGCEFDEFSERQAFVLLSGLALLKQTSSVSDYATSFHRYSVTLGWNDQALRFHFYQGLKDHVKDEKLADAAE
jgi:hypothetical protein